MHRIFKNSICVIFSSLLLSACSFSFIYNNLDWWSSWYLDDYVTLNQEQQQVFDTAFDELHAWHRQTQLREYYLQLTQLKEQVNLGITEQEISDQLNSIKNHWTIVREQAKPKLISLAHTLSDNQRNQVIDEIASNNKDRIDDRDELTDKEWYKEECKQRQQQFKKWVGKLTNRQKTEICNLIQDTASTFNHRMDYRVKWHSGLKQVFAMDLNKQQYEVMFTELISNPDSLKSDEYTALSKNNSAVAVRVFYYVMNDLTDKQQKRFNYRVDDIIDDLKALEMDD